MRELTLILILLTIVGCKSQQNGTPMWKSSKETLSNTDLLPTKYKLYNLEEQAFKDILTEAGNEKSNAITIKLPNPEGNETEFLIWKSNVANPALVEKYPNLQTYQGVWVESDAIRIRLENSVKGIQSIVLGGDDVWYVSPSEEFSDTYAIYYKKDLPAGIKSFWSDKVIKEN